MIDFYTGEGYEGAGGIGYFDYKRKKIGIARIPELLDYAVSASILVDKNIWIAPVIYYEGSSEFAPYIIEFNTSNCKYRVYGFENTLFRNFGIVKISRIDKDLICFFSGNEVVILNLKNYYWERYSIYLRVKRDSTQLFYYEAKVNEEEFWIDPLRRSIGSKIIIKYVKKNEDFFHFYFKWNGIAEVEVPFKICGESILRKYVLEYLKDI